MSNDEVISDQGRSTGIFLYQKEDWESCSGLVYQNNYTMYVLGNFHNKTCDTDPMDMMIQKDNHTCSTSSVHYRLGIHNLQKLPNLDHIHTLFKQYMQMCIIYESSGYTTYW